MVRLISGLAALAVLPQAFALVDKWTPEGFDWDGAVFNDTVPSGLWMKVSEAPPTTDLALLSPDHPRTDIGGHEHIAIIPFLGLAYRVATLVVAGLSAQSTYNTCKDTINGDTGVGPCIRGLFSTGMAFGGAYSAAKKLGGQAGRLLFPNRFRADGTVDLEMNILTRRGLSEDEALTQLGVDHFVRHQLRSLSVPGTEPDFIAYAEADHRLARREFGTHPLAPMFRFEHFKLGSMEMVTRDTLNGTYMTMALSGRSTHLLGRRALSELKARVKAKRQDAYDDETLTGGAIEARFDTEASNADPATITDEDAGQLYNAFEDSVGCMTDPGIPDSSVLDVQMYDMTNQATFGFGTMGAYSDDADADSIENVTPTGMPLPQCTS